MKKFDKKYEEIITLDNLLLAWREFLNGKRGREDVVVVSLKLMDNIFILKQDLEEKTYKHGDYKAFNISDPKPRIIHKAIVRDRLIHHLIYQELSCYFNAKFIHDSYSCRTGKGTRRAIDRFRDFGRIVSKNNTKTCWVLKCDIRKFFANIDHATLKSILEKHIQDKDILWLLSEVIDSFSTKGKVGVGLPLGNLTSQLFVNIYMNEFDQFMKRELKVKHYIRYADDFVILQNDKMKLKDLLPKISYFLENRLKLSLHPDKVFTKTLSSGVDFLGWVNFPKHRILRTSTKRRMLKKLKNNTKREVLESYRGLLSHGNAYKISARL